jgi:hypothetical protein
VPSIRSIRWFQVLRNSSIRLFASGLVALNVDCHQ